VTNALVALSIDGAPSYSWLARRCIELLRRTGTELDVVVFASRGAVLDLSGLRDVDLHEIDGDRHENVYLEKWFRLARIGAERVVFLDADTVCLQPLELLLDRYQAADLYARREAGTQRPEAQTGDQIFPAQVDWQAFDRQRGLLDGRPPVVSTGVMVFNHGACRRITRFLGALCTAYAAWSSGSRPYPCTNRHIMEELALSAALGRPGSPTLVCLSLVDVPFYAEVAAGVPTEAIVLHVWSGLYRSYLQATAPNIVAEYDRLRRCDVLRRIQAASGRGRAA
jgi:hypothetical protein